MGGFGVDGNGGMRLFGDPKTEKIWRSLEFAGRLEKGKRYVYSADVKACGNVGSVTCGEQVFSFRPDEGTRQAKAKSRTYAFQPKGSPCHADHNRKD